MMNNLTNFGTPHALVTGATNQIGRFLVPRLQAAGFTVTAFSRTPPRITTGGVVWQQVDLLTSPLPLRQPTNPLTILFHLAPLPLLPMLLARHPKETPLTRVLAFSSTSRFTKATSPDPKEQAIAKQLTAAENTFINDCQTQGIAWTLFRPTLIYGCGLDKNVTFIAKFIRRFGFFPIVGEGTGLRQPVHADDLAAACVQTWLLPSTFNKAYNLSGGQTLTYREMVEAIFHHLGKQPRIIPIPRSIFKLLTHSVTWLPAYANLSTAMIARMNQDLCFDNGPAYYDFGYQPRRFCDSA
jgi:nucleoside-diphosphate-sugar epimerase